MKTKSLLAILITVLVLSSCGSREERNKRAEEKARAKTEKKASLLKGLGEGLKGVGKDAVESVSEGVGEIFKGANEGFDQSLVSLEIEVSEELSEILKASRCKIHSDSLGKKGIIVYAVFDKDFDNKLLLKAFDKTDKELGRSSVTVAETADNARFIEFPFDERTAFTLIKQLRLEHREN